MHSVGLTIEEKNFGLITDDFSYFDGIICNDYKFGELTIKLLELDLNDIANIINVPIINFQNYLDDCRSKLFKKYNPILICLLLNTIEEILTMPKNSSHNIEEIYSDLNEYFQNIALLKMIAEKYVTNQLEEQELRKILPLVTNISAKFLCKENSSRLELCFFINDIVSLIALDILKSMEKNIVIKKCENCQKYFIPENRSDEIYCNRIFKNNKTCKQIGYEEKASKDVFTKAYRKEYKTQHQRIRYNKHIENYAAKHFEPWKEAAKTALKRFQKNNDIEGFENWLHEHHDSF